MRFVGARGKKHKEDEDEQKGERGLLSAVDAFKKYAPIPGSIGRSVTTSYMRSTKKIEDRGRKKRDVTITDDPFSRYSRPTQGNLHSSKSLPVGQSAGLLNTPVGASFALTSNATSVFRDDIEEMELPDCDQASGPPSPKEAIELEPLPSPSYDEDLWMKRLSLVEVQPGVKKTGFTCVEPECLARKRMAIYICLEEPRPDQPIAHGISLFLFATIVFSILCMILETMPELYGVISEDAWYYSEVACNVVFTTEFVLRMLTCDVLGASLMKFLMQPMNVCDFLAILPFYLQLILSSGEDSRSIRILRVLRMIRLFRIMKLARYSSSLKLMAVAFSNSLRALWVLVFFLTLGVILFSSALYYAERFDCPSRKELLAKPGAMETYVLECSDDFNNARSPSYGLCCDEFESPLDFVSIPDTFWWAIVTMTTVGYGDVYPRTTQGKWIATFTFLSGILLIALPVAIVGRKFTEVYEARNAEQRAETQRQSINGDQPESPQHSFRTGMSSPSGTSGNHEASEGTSDGSPGKKTSRSNKRQRESVSGAEFDAGESEQLTKDLAKRLEKFWVGDSRLGVAVKEFSELMNDAEEMQKAIHSLTTTKTSKSETIAGKMEMVIGAFHFGIHREEVRRSMMSEIPSSPRAHR